VVKEQKRRLIIWQLGVTLFAVIFCIPAYAQVQIVAEQLPARVIKGQKTILKARVERDRIVQKGAGAFLTAIVTKPDGARVRVPLYDDGTHSDEQAQDGLFTAVFDETDVEGDYRVNLKAQVADTETFLPVPLAFRIASASEIGSEKGEIQVQVVDAKWLEGRVDAGTIAPGEVVRLKLQIQSTYSSLYVMGQLKPSVSGVSGEQIGMIGSQEAKCQIEGGDTFELAPKTSQTSAGEVDN
jgi:hypothetical protein